MQTITGLKNRIAVLRGRNKENGRIVKKLERQLRALELKEKESKKDWFLNWEDIKWFLWVVSEMVWFAVSKKQMQVSYNG